MRDTVLAATFSVLCLALVAPQVASAQTAPPAAPAAAAPGTPAAAGDAAAPAEPACPVCPEPPPPPTTGTLRVDVTPPDATFTLNGAPQKAGAAIVAKPGAHNVAVSKAGYDAWNHTVTVAAGGSYQLSADLKKTPPAPKNPTITFGMDLGDKGAAATIDGKAVTAKKGEAVEVGPGDHEVKISKKGSKDWTQKVSLAHGARYEVTTFAPEAADDTLGPYVTIGLGVGLASLGLVFSSEGSDGGGDDDVGPGDNTDEDRATAALVLYTVGGALVATGITLIALQGGDDAEGSEDAGAALVAPYATGDGAGLAGAFTF